PAVLAWTAQHLAGWDAIDAVAVVDADCDVSPNLLAALGGALTSSGAGAAQARYVVGNPSASWLTALRWAAFALDNYVKPLARSRVGLSCGLFGTGMAFRRDVVVRLPWHAFLLTEDYEYHLQLVEAGERVVFVPDASVASAMPSSLRASRSQHARWEGGRLQLIRAYVPRMVRDGLRKRDAQRVNAATDRLVPPLTVLVPVTAALMAVAALADRSGAAVAAAVVLAGQAVYVVGGLAIARAPARVWLALLAAPGLIAWKGVLLVQQAVRGRPSRWLRTKRTA
ncbi:MAG TPA: glycosyltransferase, partial [Solirubrobacteraceae bacterium]